MLPEMCLWTGKYSLDFGNRSRPDPDLGIFTDSSTLRDPQFGSYLWKN